MNARKYRGRRIEIMVKGNAFHVYDRNYKQQFPLRPVIDALEKKFGNRPIKPRTTAISYAQKAAEEALAEYRKTRIEIDNVTDTGMEYLVLSNFDYDAKNHCYLCALTRRE